MYSLESTYVSPTMANRLDAVHISTLRKVLGIEHSWISHITNDEVLIEANKQGTVASTLHSTRDTISSQYDRVPITRVTEQLRERREKLLGHILRTDKWISCIRQPLTNTNSYITKTKKE